MSILLQQKRDKAALAAMTEGLRKQQSAANLGMLSGDEVLAPMGANLAGQVDRDLKLKMASDEKAAQRQLTQDYYNQSTQERALARSLQQERLEETKRHNLAMEQASILRASAAGRKIPPATIQRETEELVGSVYNLNNLIGSFKDDYANNTKFPFEGTLSNTLGKYGAGSQAQKDQSLWWSEYQRIYELPVRNKMFGSALTPSEQENWEKANISPNSPPEVIKAGLASMQRIAMDAAMRKGRNQATIYDKGWLMSAYSPILGEPEQPPAQDEPPPPPQQGVTSNWSDLD
jgi:hypothetical protein